MICDNCGTEVFHGWKQGPPGVYRCGPCYEVAKVRALSWEAQTKEAAND